MDNSIKILSVVGARPNFMKIAPIADAIRAHNTSQQRNQLTGRQIKHTIVHTGQHYDERMSRLFFEDLQIPKPHINLEVGSSSHAEQTAEIMKRFEPILKKERPDVVIVVGDVTSTIACAMVASKIQYPSTHNSQLIIHNFNGRRPLIAHVEAGLRSFDRSMPEEINRVLTDAIADILFITEESANENLLREGIPENKIHFAGNVMIDTLLKHREKAEQSEILYKLGLTNSQPDNMSNQANPINSMNPSNPITPYTVLTLHRPSNVDNKKTFQGILEALSVIGKDIPIIFPIHPRTLNRIHEFGFEQYVKGLSTRDSGIHCVEPLGYLDFLHLMANSVLVLTDSGGIQEETTILQVPCVTLRENTERPVTITNGTNVIAGTKKENIIQASLSQLNKPHNPKERDKPKLWDGKAADRIIDILIDSINSTNPISL